jgi:hypothetical protein
MKPFLMALAMGFIMAAARLRLTSTVSAILIHW